MESKVPDAELSQLIIWADIIADGHQFGDCFEAMDTFRWQINGVQQDAGLSNKDQVNE